ncbi:MAG: hypothetical protein IKR73_06490 [Oscillospiraceae bacterium]|nr:hypothetical protein [Oscillospiraceae bacterium]
MKRSKAFTVVEMIVIAVLILLIAGMLFLYFTFSETGAAVDLFGKTVYQTQAVNMQPAIPKGCAVIGSRDKVDSAKTGDVVLCNIADKQVLARIADILNDEGVNYYTMHYDTAKDDDVTVITQQQIIAADIRIHRPLGRLISFATSTPGIMLVIIIPSSIIIVMQVIKIVNSKHTHEESMSLADLEDIMLSDDYPEETFLPIDKSSTDAPDMSGMANGLSFGTVADKVDLGSVAQMGAPVPDEDGIIRTGSLADIFGENDISASSPKAVDIFAEDGEFFAEGATKKGFSLFDEEEVLDSPKRDSELFEETEQEPVPVLIPEPEPAPVPEPVSSFSARSERRRDDRSVLASEFYGVTAEVRSHEEERRIMKEKGIPVFEDPMDAKAESILSGLSDSMLIGDAEESPAPETNDIAPAETAYTAPETDANGFAYFNSLGDALRAVNGEPAPAPAPAPAYEPAPSYDDTYTQSAEQAADTPATDNAALFDELVAADTDSAADIVMTDIEGAAADTVQSAAEVARETIGEIPVLGGHPAPILEPERPAQPEPHTVKRVVKRKKVSVDDLLSIIDSEEKKLSE